MLKKKIDIKKQAKKLYLQVDIDGKNIYNYRQIAEKIRKKYDYEVSFQTIQRWATKEDWLGDIERLKIEATRMFGTPTETIFIEDYSNELREDYYKLAQLKNAGFKIAKEICGKKVNNKWEVLNHPVLNITDALKMIEIGLNFTYRLRRIPEFLQVDISTDPIKYLMEKGIPIPDMPIEDLPEK